MKKARKAKKAKAQPRAKAKVQPIPKGYHEVTPYLSIRGAAQAIDFYKKAFGAREVMRMPGQDGKLGHAEIAIGGSRVKFYGDRTGSVQDPFGHIWHLATHVEDIPPKEMKRRAEEKAKGG